jgi:hypothetical protein
MVGIERFATHCARSMVNFSNEMQHMGKFVIWYVGCIYIVGNINLGGKH